MLSLTDTAADLVRTLADDAGLPPSGGVRIDTDPSSHALSMGLSANPDNADTVVAKHGARLFLSSPAAERLADATLCAEVSADRSVFFLDR